LNYRKPLILLISIATILRILLASNLELSNTEVYYWVFSNKLEWNYFDHPPIVAWLIRLSTLNNFLHTEIAVRVGAIICAATCTILIYQIGTSLDNERTGWFAAVFYTGTIYGSISAGTFIIPDSPQMVCWFAGILILCQLVNASDEEPGKIKKWVIFGILAGLCVMSKLHGIFLCIGVIMYASFVNRRWLKQPGLYISLAITCVVASPILIWNIQHHFVTYTFHSQRITINSGIHPVNFITQLLGVILLYNPVSFYLLVKNLMRIATGKFPIKSNALFLLLFCSMPLVSVLLIVSLFRETYAHWPGPGYSTLLLLPAIGLSNQVKSKTKKMPMLLKIALTIPICVGLFLFLGTRFFPGTFSEEKEGLFLGKGDGSLDMYGWRELGISYDSLYKKDITNHVMAVGTPLIITKWFPAAHEDFYIGNLTCQETIGLGGIDSLHQYFWLNQNKKALNPGDNGYYIIPSNQFNYKSLDQVLNSFSTYNMAISIPQYRGGVVCKEVYVFRLMGYLKRDPRLKF
jgi:4-amino-4-deoxy-L-arabinose transferase-like glycosyltransferase